MKVFCHYISDAILETFHLDVDVHVSRLCQDYVSCVLYILLSKKRLSSYSNFDNVIEFVSDF